MSRRRIHVPRDRIAGGRARLDPAAWHYLRDVLRLEPGAPLEVFDGEGGIHEAEVPAAGEPLLLGPRRPAAPPGAALWLAFAPPRGDRADWVVQKATELGALRLLPFESGRSVVRLAGPRGAARAERWRRIAVEAARQCGRADVPAVDAPATLLEALARAPAGFRRVVLFEGGGEPFERGLDRSAPGHLLAVGPEGGFTAGEMSAASAAGARVVSLGPRILRAETAALAAVALAQHLLGDLG
ncbi:MAG TPA: RsmE family RNA methyltransferase [Anaeromyxobacteraceae bacterium]|jgi:16S rRNA (uracil1498-N3)-methyltransferase